MNNKAEIFNLITQHLINDASPSKFLIAQMPLLAVEPFDVLLKLQSTPQSPIHHPEGNAWNHTLLVVDEAAKLRDKSKNKEVFMWASLLHDIGKPETTATRKGRITSYNHEEVGAKLAIKFLHQFTDDEKFIDEVAMLVKFHMQMLFVLNDLPFAKVKEMTHSCDINEIALLGLCDRLGRKGADVKAEGKNMKTFIEKCKSMEFERSNING